MVTKKVTHKSIVVIISTLLRSGTGGGMKMTMTMIAVPSTHGIPLFLRRKE
jgi:hypothetical protein